MNEKSKHRKDMTDVATGIEASRSVGFALMYEERRAKEALQRHNRTLLKKLARLAMLIEESEALRVLEPEGELVRAAIATLVTVRTKGQGPSIIAELLEERNK